MNSPLAGRAEVRGRFVIRGATLARLGVLSLSWSLAAGLCFYGIAGQSGIVGAGLGGGGGVWLAAGSSVAFWPSSCFLASEARSRFQHHALLFCGILGLGALFLFGPGFARFLSQSIQHGEAAQTLKEGEFYELFFRSLTVVTILRLLSTKYSVCRTLEVCALMLALVYPIKAHRHGHLDDPHWLGDAMQERGLADGQVFYWVSVSVGLVAAAAVLVQWVPENEAQGSRLMRGSLAGVSLVVLSALLVQFLPRPPFEPRQPPTPPRISSSSLPPPPPAPEPKLLALVELADTFYRPKEGYLFRQNILSRVEGLSFEKEQVARADELREFPAEPRTLLAKHSPDARRSPAISGDAASTRPPSGRSAVADQVRTRTWVLGELASPILLVAPSRYEPERSFDARVKYCYEVTSSPFAYKGNPRLDFGSLKVMLGQTFDNENWSGPERSSYLRLPDRPRLFDLRDRILAPFARGFKGAPPKRLHALIGWLSDCPDLSTNKTPAILAIVDWLDVNGIFSSSSGADSRSGGFDTFLFGRLRGDALDFAVAAALLFRSAGVPSRVAEGFCYPCEDGSGDRFLITDQLATAWPEVYLSGAGWIPILIRPQNVEDRQQPTPQKTLELRLAESFAKDNVSQRERGGILRRGIEISLGVAAAGVAGVLLLRAAAFVRRFRIPPQRSITNENAFRIVYGRITEILAIAGYRRRDGDSWEEFCTEIQRRNARLGESFRKVTMMNCQDYNADRSLLPPGRREEWLRAYVASRSLYSSLVWRAFLRWLVIGPKSISVSEMHNHE